MKHNKTIPLTKCIDYLTCSMKLAYPKNRENTIAELKRIIFAALYKLYFARKAIDHKLTISQFNRAASSLVSMIKKEYKVSFLDIPTLLMTQKVATSVKYMSLYDEKMDDVVAIDLPIYLEYKDKYIVGTIDTVIETYNGLRCLIYDPQIPDRGPLLPPVRYLATFIRETFPADEFIMPFSSVTIVSAGPKGVKIIKPKVYDKKTFNILTRRVVEGIERKLYYPSVSKEICETCIVREGCNYRLDILR